MYTIERTTSSGKTTTIKTVDTLRKAKNVMMWAEEHSSKSSTIKLIREVDAGVWTVIETRQGLN